MHMPLKSLALALTIGCTLPAIAAERPTFYKDILPVLQENCQECHRPAGANFGGMVAPMALMTYDEVRPWAKSIVKQITAREMPPWDAAPEHTGQFRNERVLTDEEITMITDWVNSGASRGNPKEGPEPLKFEDNDGWTIGEPDLVVTMPEPFHVTDDMYDVYTQFYVDLNKEQLPADAWITAFQCKPDSKVIHHFNCHLLEPLDGELPPPPNTAISTTLAPQNAGKYLGGISSGSDPVVWPEGFGIPMAAGSRVTFDIHYHKEPGPGTGVMDQSQIGFMLTDEEPTRAMGGAAPMMRFNINIPAGEKRWKLGPAAQTLQHDVEVVSYMPHMHMRGSEALFEAFYPDGTHEVLLHVPKYDFAWQTVYYLNELKTLPKGTKVQFTAWYDNSPEYAEQRGFDANQNVRYGQKSSDEMMMGFMMTAIKDEESD